MNRLLSVLALIPFTSSSALAQKVGDRMVVIRRCEVKIGNVVSEEVNPGNCLTVRAVNCKWLWVADGIPGWIESANTTSIGKAIPYFTAQIQENPQDSSAFAARALVRADKVEYDTAIEDLSEAIRLNPSQARNYDWRGYCWNKKHEWDRAIVDFNESLRLDAKRTSSWNRRGIAWRAKKEYAKAIADFTEAIRLEPRNGKTYNNRGNALREMKRFVEAIDDYSTAIRLEPMNAIIYGNRGACWAEMQKYDKAIADFSMEIRLDPKHADAYWGRILAYTMDRQFEKAIVDYSTLMRLTPKDADVFSAAAWLRATCSDPKCRDGKRAVTNATIACELTEWKDAESLGTLAAAHAEAGNFDEAVKWQKKAIGMVPESDKADYEIRLELFKSGKPY